MQFLREPVLRVTPLNQGEPLPAALVETLFAPPLRCFALLDGAQIANLPELLAASDLPHACLFQAGADGGEGVAGP